MQNKVRDMAVEHMQRYMIEHGFFPGSSADDDCALYVLGFSQLSQAKQSNMAKFTAVVTMVNSCISSAWCGVGLMRFCLPVVLSIIICHAES